MEWLYGLQDFVEGATVIFSLNSISSIHHLLKSNSSAFSLKVEKFIHDYRMGTPDLSRQTRVELGFKDMENADYLAGRKTNYLSYSTMLSYDKRARFTHGVNTLVENMKLIEQGAESLDLEV